MKLLAFCLSSLVMNVLLAETFTIDFNEHPLCKSTSLGQLKIGNDSVCHTDHTGLAEGVSVSGDASDDGHVVVFYQFDGCRPMDDIAASNAPFCVAAGYGSFKIVDVKDCCLESAFFQGNFQGWTHRNASRADLVTTVTTDLTQATTAPSLALRDHLSGEQTPNDVDHSRVYHGVIRVQGDQQYKMHQIADGTFQGVSLEEWDDSIHVKDDTKLDISGIELADPHTNVAVSHPGSSNALESRVFSYATCQVILQCVYSMGTHTVVGLEGVVETLVQSAFAAYNRAGDATSTPLTNRDDIWNFLNRPFIAKVTSGSQGSTTKDIYTIIQTTKADTSVSQCSDGENEAIVIKEVIYGALSAQHGGIASDASILVTLPNGHSAGLMVSARPTGDAIPEVCGAPTVTFN